MQDKREPARRTLRLPRLRSLIDFALVLGGTGFATAAGFLIKIYIGRHLGPGELGIFSVSYAVLSTMSILADLGIRYSLVHLGSRTGQRDRSHLGELVAAGLVFKLLGGLLVLGLGWILAPWAAQAVFQKPNLTPFLQIASVGIFLWALWDAVEGCLHILQKFSLSAGLRIIMDAARLVAFFGLFSYQSGRYFSMDRFMWLYFLAPGLSVLVGLPLIVVLFRPRYTHLGSSSRELLAFSRGVFFYRSATMLLLFLDSLMLSRYGSLAEVGQYEAAKGLAFALLLISESLGMVLLPKVNQIQCVDELKNMLGRCAAYFAALVVAAGVWLSVASRFLILFGPRFDEPAVVTTFKVLVIATLVTIPATIMGMVLLSLHRPWALAAVASIQVLVGLVVYPQTCHQGIVATAWTGTGLQFLGSLLLLLYLQAQLRSQGPLRS